ncbi:hypothetical protein BX616_002421, partial [Lobosporangium transversale]
MEKALELPEIIACISKYLNKKDILNCICVRKTWMHELEPLLWRSFTCKSSRDVYGAPSESKRPSLVLMQRNAHHIRQLTIEEMNPAYHIAFFCQCTHLDEVTLSITRHLPQTEAQILWKRFSDMVRNHIHLRKIVIENNNGAMLSPLDVPASFLETLCTCPKLIVLETFECSFDAQATAAYMKISGNNIKRLSSCRDAFSDQIQLEPGFIFKELRYLDIKELWPDSIAQQLEWIRRCPNLISVHWDLPRETIPVQAFCDLIPRSCPDLIALHLPLPYITDADIAQILNAFPRIEKLTLSNTMFGPLAFAALERHFPTLKDINLQHASMATSSMIQQIMASCPNLLSISGDQLSYEDIKTPWVCRNLQMFDVGINIVSVGLHGTGYCSLVTRPVTRDKEVYGMLAQLTNLEYLSIASSNTEQMGRFFGYPIQMSLQAGFTQLRTLKNLKFFSCKSLMELPLQSNQIELMIEWMIKHWRCLEILEGAIMREVDVDGGDGDGDGMSDDKTSKISELLEKHGIKFVNFNQLMDDIDEDYELEDDDVDEEDQDSNDLDYDVMDDEYSYFDLEEDHGLGGGHSGDDDNSNSEEDGDSTASALNSMNLNS